MGKFTTAIKKIKSLLNKLTLLNTLALLYFLPIKNTTSLLNFYPYYIIAFMITEVTKLTNGNRVVIPTAIRKSLGLQVGDAVTLVLEDNGAVRLLTQAEAVRQAQTLVRQHVDKDRSLVEELLAERREEVAGRE